MVKVTKTNVINALGVRGHFDISQSTLYRWMRDETLGFPKPVKTINKRYYWRLAEILAWEPTPSVDGPKKLDGLEVLTGPICEYGDLVAALRDRRGKLKLPVLEVDALSGMQEGYTNKLENWDKDYGRGAGPESLPRWLRGLRVRIVLVALPSAS